jgi:cytidine deaminase
VNEKDDQLFARAEAVAARAYAPYSRFQVGAAVLTRDGHIVEGVNSENAAYPLGICAERAALSHAVVEGYKPGDLEAIAITASPCGGCRQWLIEFRVPRVVYRNASGEVVVRSSEELLPDTFQF